jgi:hypothetical protein
MKTKQFAVYEKKPEHGNKENGVILAPFKTRELALEAAIKYGYIGSNYYIDEYDFGQ